MSGRLVGIQIRTGSDAHNLLVLRAQIERTAADEFTRRYGFEPSDERTWRLEPAHTETDFETGEDYDVPDTWFLLVEGEMEEEADDGQ